MVDEVAFNATKSAFYQYGLFFKAVADEYGLEKAMGLHAKSYETYGADAVKAIKGSTQTKIDLETMSSILEEMLKATGWETERIVEGPGSAVLRHTRCPECEGLLQAGLDPDTVRARCIRSVETVTPYLRELVPGVRLGVRRWDAPQICDEELVLE